MLFKKTYFSIFSLNETEKIAKMSRNEKPKSISTN